MPSPQETLRHLEQFRQVLWLDNPCTVRRGRCVYLAADAPQECDVETLESQYYLEVRTLPSFITTDEFADIQRDTELRPSDSYICHGSTSQGSGRSVTKGQHQIKGVGRTVQATWHPFYRDINGALSLRDAAVEAVFEKRLRRILATPPIPIDFILLPEHDTPALLIKRRGVDIPVPDIRCVAGRRGSPLRIGHLEYMAAALRVTKETAVGSYLVHLLLSHFGGVPDAGIEARVLEVFDILLQRAVRLSAESLVYALGFSYWPDNFDLFSRVFDVAETEFFFPSVLRDTTPVVMPADGETPTAFLMRLELHAHHQRRTFTLTPIRNVLSAIHLIWKEIGLPASRLDARYSWSWFNRVHRESVLASLAPMFGISGEAASAALGPLADRFPLVDEIEEFNWPDVIASTCADPAIAAVADVSAGEAFRELLTRIESERVVAEITDYLQGEIVGPYLRSGIGGVHAVAIPHLA